MNFLNDIKNNSFLLFIVSLTINIILLIVCIYLLLTKTPCNCKLEDYIEKDDSANIATNITDTINVEIKGAVSKPNVYSIPSNSIINDIVKSAGGFNKDAYTKNINLSKKVSDELVIYVYTKNEYKKLINSKKVKDEVKQVTCETSSYDISNCIDNGTSEIISGTTDTKFEVEKENEPKGNTTNNLININTASKEDLLKITGIGDGKADAIIKYRSENGNFTKIEDIKNVSGIGDSLFEKIKDSITV